MQHYVYYTIRCARCEQSSDKIYYEDFSTNDWYKDGRDDFRLVHNVPHHNAVPILLRNVVTAVTKPHNIWERE